MTLPELPTEVWENIATSDRSVFAAVACLNKGLSQRLRRRIPYEAFNGFMEKESGLHQIVQDTRPCGDHTVADREGRVLWRQWALEYQRWALTVRVCITRRVDVPVELQCSKKNCPSGCRKPLKSSRWLRSVCSSGPRKI